MKDLKTKSVEFIGLPSGDMECFCWDVTPEEFKKVKGVEPDDMDWADYEFDGNKFIPTSDRLRLYPNDIFTQEYLLDNEGEITGG